MTLARMISAIMIFCVLAVGWARDIPKRKIVFNYSIHDTRLWQEQDQSWWGKLLKLFQGEKSPPVIQPLGLDAKDKLLAVVDPHTGGVHLFSMQGRKHVFIPFNSELKQAPPVDIVVGKRDTLYVVGGNPQRLWLWHKGMDGFESRPLDFTPRRVTGLTYINNTFLMVDTPLHIIYRVSLSGKLLQKGAQRGKNLRGLNYPTFIAVSDSLVYITDTMNFRVVGCLIDSLTNWLHMIGGPGVMSGQLNRPKGVAVDASGAIYIVDASFDNVQIFSPEGRLLDVFGRSGHGPGEFSGPTDIAVDGNWIYVSDTLNHCVKVFQIIYE